MATRRRKTCLGSVCRLSKFTTQSEGTPSAAAVRSSSETRWRLVRVSAATTTDWMRSATGSRVRTSTGGSPPPVAANQTSPRCIGPIRPILGGTPISDFGERLLCLRWRKPLPGVSVVLALQPHEVWWRALRSNSDRSRPNFSAHDCAAVAARVVDTKAEHRHTLTLLGMTISLALFQAQDGGAEVVGNGSWLTGGHFHQDLAVGAERG